MATTSKARPSRSWVSNTRRKPAGSESCAKTPSAPNYYLPEGLISALEAYRTELQIALSILSAVDATLEQREDGGGDVLDAGDSADAQVLKARVLARPLDLVRLAIQRVYQVHSDLDSCNLRRAAGGAK